MGACTFQDTIEVAESQDYRDAYRIACDQAIAECGHQDGYNGTISTTCGVKLLPTPENINDFIDDVLENGKYGIEKYEKAGCIEVPANKGSRKFIFFGWAVC